MPWQSALRVGAITLAVLLFGFVGLTALIPIQSAIVSKGRLVLSQSTHWVQHPAGGQVQTLHVSAGQRVDRGDVLLVLNDRDLVHQRAAHVSSLLELHARRARLIAQHEGDTDIAFGTVSTGSDPMDIPKHIKDAQSALLRAAQLSWTKQTAQMRKRQDTLQRQIAATEARISALEARLSLFLQDLNQQNALVEKGVVADAGVRPLKHQIAEIRGELAALRADQAAFDGQVVEIELDLARQSAARRAEALSDLGRVDQDIEELRQALSDIARQADSLRLRAPFAGHVHDLRLTTAQTVLRAADPAMAIVPLGEGTQVKVRVSPQDIDHIYPHQPARVHLDGHNADVWQEGQVTRVSPDVLFDAASAQSYFEVEIALDHTIGDFSNDARLGMPVTAYFATRSNSMLSYLIAPILNYGRKAFRET